MGLGDGKLRCLNWGAEEDGKIESSWLARGYGRKSKKVT